MPNLNYYRTAHTSATLRLSENNRTFAISAIGIIWLFANKTKDGSILLDSELKFAAFFIFLSLALDFLQYFYKSLAWYCYFRFKEISMQKIPPGKIDEQAEMHAPNIINALTYIFFYSKLCAVVVAYWNIGEFLLKQLL